MNTMLMSPESRPCVTSVLQLVIGFRDYHITRAKQNHQPLSSTASCWARRTGDFQKPKLFDLWQFRVLGRLVFLYPSGSSDTPESQAQCLSSRGPVLACTTTRLDHAKRKESS